MCAARYPAVMRADIPRWWLFGLPAITWIRHSELVEQIVESHRLRSYPIEGLATEVMMAPQFEGADQPEAAATTSLAARFPKPLPYPGGLRVPHLHYKGDIFVVNDKQWQEFTKGVLEGFRAKLAKAQTVSVEQLVELSEAIDALP
jgi:hypothetical protein